MPLTNLFSLCETDTPFPHFIGLIGYMRCTFNTLAQTQSYCLYLCMSSMLCHHLEVFLFSRYERKVSSEPSKVMNSLLTNTRVTVLKQQHFTHTRSLFSLATPTLLLLPVLYHTKCQQQPTISLCLCACLSSLHSQKTYLSIWLSGSHATHPPTIRTQTHKLTHSHQPPPTSLSSISEIVQR